jgi:hypothetical protein
MVMIRTILAAAALSLLAACEMPPELRPGSPSPATARAARPPAPPPAARPPAAPAPREARGGRPALPPAEAAEGTAYRVVADGTVGCADPQALRVLRQLRGTEGAGPRLLAQAHRDGRCMTVFQSSTWTAEATEGDLIRLRLAEGGSEGQPIALYFLRDEVRPR